MLRAAEGSLSTGEGITLFLPRRHRGTEKGKKRHLMRETDRTAEISRSPRQLFRRPRKPRREKQAKQTIRAETCSQIQIGERHCHHPDGRKTVHLVSTLFQSPKNDK